MPLSPGYSRTTISHNIERLKREGFSFARAAVIAYSQARASFKKTFPRARMPMYLIQRNPARVLSNEVEQGRQLYQSFTGHDAKLLKRIRKPVFPRVGVAIGHILGIIYETRRSGRIENYRHDFGKSSRPLFVVSPDGKQLLMLGGAFDFTERGIVDRAVRTNRKRKGRRR